LWVETGFPIFDADISKTKRMFKSQPPVKTLLALFSSILVLIFVASFAPPPSEDAWGFFGHRKINHQAVFSLPPEMMPFFKNNIDYLTEHAVDADKRRYASPYEAVRHYIDLDVYGEMPFANLPRTWTDALIQYSDLYFVNEKSDTVELVFRDSVGAVLDFDGKMAFHPGLTGGITRYVDYGDFRSFFIQNYLPRFYDDEWTVPCDSLAKFLHASPDSFFCQQLIAVDRLSGHGILPWHLQHMLSRLTAAFVEKDSKKILRYAADIGHYIADAHVPLHTTENYNGQLSGQDGIHAFWESRIPELFANEGYDFWVGKAHLIENPKDYFWSIVLESHSLVDSVLAIELDLRNSFPPDLQMCPEMRGQRLVRTQCEAFAAAYAQRMGGMVERRMREAIRAVSSAWFTAWVTAGQPDLSTLDQPLAVADSLDVGAVEGKKGVFIFRKHE